MKKLKSIFLIGGTFSLAMKIYYDEICYRIGREGLMETYDSPNLDLMETPLD